MITSPYYELLFLRTARVVLSDYNFCNYDFFFLTKGTGKILNHFLTGKFEGGIERQKEVIWKEIFQNGKEIKEYKTDVINDPLGQTHSLTSSDPCFRLKFVLFWKVGTDGRTNGRHVQKQWSLLWVGLVDQKDFQNYLSEVHFSNSNSEFWHNMNIPSSKMALYT